ncbi:hypothetical protein HAX54_036456 [Datura stramonium]|uniref:Uncharacterized protein n=1 Tax=Datura stramonium TaxID=4076 RepID=A0ABS8VJX4_DATST|nr:hypothetical protein [Datura stramonium]
MAESSVLNSLKNIIAHMSYALDEGVWIKKSNYKPKIKYVSPEGPSSVKIDEAQGAILNSILSEAQEIKQSLGVVVCDLHKCTKLLGKLSTDMTSLQAQISLIQKEGVKSFNLVLKQVDSIAARVKVLDNKLVVAIQNSYSSVMTQA